MISAMTKKSIVFLVMFFDIFKSIFSCQYFSMRINQDMAKASQVKSLLNHSLFCKVS